MAGIGRKAALPLESSFVALQHPIERYGQASQLVVGRGYG